METTTYEKRKEAKIEYAENKATQLKQESENFFSKSFCESTGIPFGQPILVGHHSEQRHRNAIKRYENGMRKQIDNSNKAEYYEKKAERLKNDKVISSDDPEAKNKITAKINELEEKKLKIKQLKKEGKEFPYYTIPYLSQDIKRLNGRLVVLEHRDKVQEVEQKINGVILKVDKEANRIKLFFDGKPDQEIRTKLKSKGFRWSPFNGCWQCYINDYNLDRARTLLEELA